MGGTDPSGTVPPVMGGDSTAPVMGMGTDVPPVMSGVLPSAGPVMGGSSTGTFQSIKEDDDDVTKKCKGDDPKHVMPPDEIKMKKLLKGFGNTKQDICDALGKMKKMKPEKQMKIFGAM